MADHLKAGSDFPTAPENKKQLEEGTLLAPRFDSSGLVTAIVTDIEDGAVLMLAHMNSEALALTLSTGIAHYYSRSRAALWKKGESSGNVQTVHEVRTDCDQDAILLAVSVSGHAATCHTGRRSCFYRRVETIDGKSSLAMVGDEPRFDPEKVY